MMNFYKRDTLNDKFEEFENRFQLKLDEQNIAHKTHIQKLDDKITRLEIENRAAGEGQVMGPFPHSDSDPRA